MTIKSRKTTRVRPVAQARLHAKANRQVSVKNPTYFVGVVRWIPTGHIIVFGTKQSIQERIYEEFARARKYTWAATALRDELRKIENLQDIDFHTGIHPLFEVVEEIQLLNKESMLKVKKMMIDKYDAKNPEKGFNGR